MHDLFFGLAMACRRNFLTSKNTISRKYLLDFFSAPMAPLPKCFFFFQQFLLCRNYFLAHCPLPAPKIDQATEQTTMNASDIQMHLTQ